MSAMAAEPLPRITVKFWAHDFGLMELPPLHSIEEAGQRLLDGDYSSVLMDDAVPAELIDTLKGRTPSEAARFFFMWVIAGFDFEAAHWSQIVSLYRTMPDLSNVAKGYEDEDLGDPTPSPDLVTATALYDKVEDIADALVAKWALR